MGSDVESLNAKMSAGMGSFATYIRILMAGNPPKELSKKLELITDNVNDIFKVIAEVNLQVRDSAVIKEKEKKANTLERIIATEYLKEETSKNVLGKPEQEMIWIVAATKGVNQLIAITKESATELKDIVLETVNAGTLGRIAALLKTTKQKIDAAAGGLNAIAQELTKKEKAGKDQAQQVAIIAAIKTQGEKLEQEINGVEQKLEQEITGLKQEIARLSDLLTQFLASQQNKEGNK
jgi:cell division protein ZapA (FtsZ GTPase activity inhibitor)